MLSAVQSSLMNGLIASKRDRGCVRQKLSNLQRNSFSSCLSSYSHQFPSSYCPKGKRSMIYHFTLLLHRFNFADVALKPHSESILTRR